VYSPPVILWAENQGTQNSATSSGTPNSEHYVSTPLVLKPRTAHSTKSVSK